MRIVMLKSIRDIDRDISLTKGKSYKVLYSNSSVIYIEDDNEVKVGLGTDCTGYIYYFIGDNDEEEW